MPRVPVLALVLLAAAEICVIIVVAHLIGVVLTIAALAGSTVAGLWLVRIQGHRAWRALQGAVEGGVLPERELGDAALIFAGGALIAIPGFVTDALGLCAVTPLTRPLVRRALGAYVARRTPAATGGPPPGPPGQEEPPAKIIRGQVIDSRTGKPDDGTRPGTGEGPR